jgi:hypothetical protein
VKPIKDLREIEIVFPLPDQLPNYEKNPGSYVAHLIGHESNGSVLALLKKKGELGVCFFCLFRKLMGGRFFIIIMLFFFSRLGSGALGFSVDGGYQFQFLQGCDYLNQGWIRYVFYEQTNGKRSLLMRPLFDTITISMGFMFSPLGRGFDYCLSVHPNASKGKTTGVDI